MSDMLTMLRATATTAVENWAANEIERLRAENASLQQQLADATAHIKQLETGFDKLERQNVTLREALRAHGEEAAKMLYPNIPDGWLMVPKEPTSEHLESIAMRHRHDFGLLPGYQQETLRLFARQMYEECTGQGFHNIAAAPKPE